MQEIEGSQGRREGRDPGLRQDHLLPGAPAAHPSQSQPARPRSQVTQGEQGQVVFLREKEVTALLGVPWGSLGSEGLHPLTSKGPQTR